jgi:hypothetical protein
MDVLATIGQNGPMTQEKNSSRNVGYSVDLRMAIAIHRDWGSDFLALAPPASTTDADESVLHRLGLRMGASLYWVMQWRLTLQVLDAQAPHLG